MWIALKPRCTPCARGTDMTESECREVMRADNPDFILRTAPWPAYPRGCWLNTGKYNGKVWKLGNTDVYYFNSNKISFDRGNYAHYHGWLAMYR